MKPINSRLTTLALGLAAGTLLCASSLAASAIAYGYPVNSAWPYAVAVNPSYVTAVKQAKDDLRARGYRPFISGYDLGRGYYALAGDVDAAGNLRGMGVGTACLTQRAAMELAIQRARAQGAKQPKVVRTWADIDFPTVRPLTPITGQVKVHRPTTFTWAAVPLAGKYNVQVEYLPPGRPATQVDISTVTGTSYISQKLGPGRTYRWRIQAVSEEGSVTGPWCAWRSFSTRVTG